MSGGMRAEGVRCTTPPPPTHTHTYIHIHTVCVYVCMFECLAAIRWPASLICADSFVIGALHDVGGPAADNTPTV